MIYGLYVSAAGLQAAEHRQDVLANNLANAQTPGFKRDLAVVQTRANAVREDPRMAAYRVPVLDRQGDGVLLGAGAIDLTQASLQQTGNKTDVALEGEGFFQVEGTDPGQPLLTRDGRFLLRDDGQLVTATGGRAVLSSTGEPIKLNPALAVAINGHGEISQGGVAVSQLALVEPEKTGDLVKQGTNLLTVQPGAAVRPAPAATQVRQGYVESSGVDPMVEMVAMLEGQRVFEANAKMIQYQDQTLQQLSMVGRVA